MTRETGIKDVWEGQGFKKSNVRQEETRTRILKELLLYDRRLLENEAERKGPSEKGQLSKDIKKEN